MHCFANIELRRIVKAPYNLWTDMNVKNNLKWCSNAISYKLFPYDITIGMELFENDREKKPCMTITGINVVTKDRRQLCVCINV